MIEEQKAYLIKRSPDFTRNGIIVKRNQKSKEYSQGTLLSVPLSDKLEKGDMIYVAEKDYGIYAKGIVNEVSKIIPFSSVDEILEYYLKNKSKDAAYWLDFIQRLKKAKTINPDAVLRYQEFTIDQKILERVIPYTGELSDLKTIQTSIYKLPNFILDIIEKLIFNLVNKLETKIPNSLRLDLYSLFNKQCNLATWIDIDHFVPQSIGGPGNIPENLIPVGFNLNRYKSDYIPIGLFYVALRYPQVQFFCEKSFFECKKDFIKTPEATDKAKKIIFEIKKLDILSVRQFFKKILEYHHPFYIQIIEKFNY